LYKSSNNINYYLTSGDDFIVKYGWNIPEKFQDGKLKKNQKKDGLDLVGYFMRLLTTLLSSHYRKKPLTNCIL